MVDLERHVAQLEALLEQALKAAPRTVAVGVRRDEDVRRESREAARHGPDVQVVHLDDLGIVDERPRATVGASATTSTTPPRTSGGEARRRAAPYTIQTPTSSRVTPFAWAASRRARPRR